MQQFLNSMYNALGAVLAFIYSVVPNLGLSIILLTLVVMLILYPLTAKQAKSMIAMQRVQPEVKKLQAKYKGDRQKLNEEMMKFYQENKINPLAGCLPLVVQLPIFFVLFRVLRTPYQHIPKTGSFVKLYTDMCGAFGNLCGKSTSKAQTITLTTGVQKVIQSGSAAAHLTHLSFLGVDLQKTATDPSLNFTSAVPYFVLVLLVMFTGYLQTKQAQSRTPAANKQMNTVMKVLPVFFGLISLSFPAGLVLYFFVSNTFRLGQQELIFRRLGTAASPAGGTPKLGSGDRKAAAIDVASSERTAEPDESSETTAGAEDGQRDGNGRKRPAVSPKAGSRPTPKPAPRKPAPRPPAPQRATVPEQRVRGGGLRAMFQLPPPPPGNGGGRPTPARPQASGNPPRPAGTGNRGRPAQPSNRRRSNKKRKR